MVGEDVKPVGIDRVVRELRGVLQAPRTAPEWRWNTHRRLHAARAALPAQAAGGHDELDGRLGALTDGALDRLAAGTIAREVSDLIDRLEPLAG